MRKLAKDLLLKKPAKDLGVILNSNLTYDEQIIKTASSCMSRLGQINRVKHVYDQPPSQGPLLPVPGDGKERTLTNVHS